ncbi:MAG TPA: efflux RND transporter periplasmic adaptor subunit [Vicinamibacterales bacterium]
MTDLKQDLAALRIEREPERPGVGRWIGWAIVLLVLAGAGAGVWAWATRERPIDVEVATVTERPVGTQAAVLNASGYVTARRRATVSSKITGKVIEVNVEEGMVVTQGQVLARLDDSTARAALALAKAQAESARQAVKENEVHLVQARLTFRRVDGLRKEGITTEAELDQARADADGTEARINALREQVNVAERQIELQQTDLDNTIIRAPFTGVAISKDAQPGEMVSPVSAGGGFTRTGICTIVDMRSLEIEVDVNESYINRVRPAQHVSAVLDAYPDWQIPGHVITTVPTADRQKATVLVRIAFEALDPRILPDMGVKVTFLRDEDEAAAPAVQQATTLVPKAAIQSDNTNSFVYVVSGDTVERRAVKVGGADGDRVEVLAALRAGERVVVSPLQSLSNGAKVVVK